MKHDLRIMGKEAVMDHFKEQYWYLLECTE
jgi:hypothetical protein